MATNGACSAAVFGGHSAARRRAFADGCSLLIQHLASLSGDERAASAAATAAAAALHPDADPVQIAQVRLVHTLERSSG